MRPRGRVTLLGLCVACLGACARQPAAPVRAPRSVDPPSPFRIAFGSCNDLAEPQLLWDAIVASSPQLWIWLGDNVYADTGDPLRMRELYNETRAFPGYARLRRSTTVIGTWDDHDYGGNDLGSDNPAREVSQTQLLDFLDEPPDSPRRKQAGVYAAYDFGRDDNIVRVILLDTRYHREPPGPNADVLGAAQWAWLGEQLSGSPAAVHLIGSSIQVIADEHDYEKWADFPAARTRLLSLIADSGAPNVVLISGDRHFAELSRLDDGRGGALYDLTSSSLSRPWEETPTEANSHRVHELYPGVNFGLIEVDWLARAITLQIRGVGNAVEIEQRLPLSNSRSPRPRSLSAEASSLPGG